MKLWQIICLVCIWGTYSAQSLDSSNVFRSIDPALQKEIDDFVRNVYFPYSNTSKLGLSLVQNNGEILYSTGYGMADEDKYIPNSNETQFLIASVTKSFTSLIVVKVLHELFPEMGEAVLDTPIRKLVSSSNFTLQDRFRSEHGTFRDLLAHRMCLFRLDLPLLAHGLHNSSEIAYRQRYNQEICGMRTEFQYNNQMYVMAGTLVELLTNKSFDQLMDELLKDIGMLNSTLSKSSDDNANMPYRSQPYYVINNVSYPMNVDLMNRIAPTSPAGGLYAPPNDMVKYMLFHLNKGNANGRQIIPEEVMAWTIKPAIAIPGVFFKQNEGDLVGTSYAYGLGLFLAALDGWQYNHHSGYMSPYASLMSLFPTQKLGVFTSANEGPAYLDAAAVHAFIFQLLQGTSPSEARANAIKTLRKQKIIKENKDAKLLKDLQKLYQENLEKTRKADADIVGSYGSGSAGEAEILEKFNEETNSTQLYVQYGKWHQGWLQNIGGPLYQIHWTTDIVQEFYSQGDTVGLGHLLVEDEVLEFVIPYDGSYIRQGKFQLGVSLDKLPPIPWSPESCGPE